MKRKKLSPLLQNHIQKLIRQEKITSSLFHMLSCYTKKSSQKKLFLLLSQQEDKHAKVLARLLPKKQTSATLFLSFYSVLLRCFGTSFVVCYIIKKHAQNNTSYLLLKKHASSIQNIKKEHVLQQKKLSKIISRSPVVFFSDSAYSFLFYQSELSGALLGILLSLQNTRIVASAGILTSIAASFFLPFPKPTKKTLRKKIFFRNPIFYNVLYVILTFLYILPLFFIENSIQGVLIVFLTFIIFSYFFVFVYATVQQKSLFSVYKKAAKLFTLTGFITFFIGFILRTILHIRL